MFSDVALVYSFSLLCNIQMCFCILSILLLVEIQSVAAAMSQVMWSLLFHACQCTFYAHELAWLLLHHGVYIFSTLTGNTKYFLLTRYIFMLWLTGHQYLFHFTLLS